MKCNGAEVGELLINRGRLEMLLIKGHLSRSLRKRGNRHVHIWEKSIPGRRNNRSKRTKAGICLACLRNNRKTAEFTQSCTMIVFSLGLPWRLSGKESQCQCRRHRFDPWPGKILHAMEQLSPCTKLLHLDPVLHNKGSHCNELPMHCDEDQCSLNETNKNRAQGTQCKGVREKFLPLCFSNLKNVQLPLQNFSGSSNVT